LKRLAQFQRFSCDVHHTTADAHHTTADGECQPRQTRILGLIAMPAPTIVYDLDGTLADTAEDLVATLNWLLVREGLKPLKVDSAGSLLGAGARALIARGFAASGRSLEPHKLEALFVDYLSYYAAHIKERSQLYPGVEKALAAFERAGWRQAVCTNKTESLAKLLIKKLGIAERFAFVCGQDTFGVGKPDGRPLLETIAASGGAKERAIMVGDSGTDIETARAANVPVIAVDFGYADVPVNELGPDRVISHFDELMAACGALLEHDLS
jgi:phosphoglycolate phosphatase